MLTYYIPLTTLHETIISELTTDAVIFNSKIQLLICIQIMLTKLGRDLISSIATTRLAEWQQLRPQTIENNSS